MHMLLLGNDATGTIYQVVFETPVTAWDKEWPIAEPVFKQLVLGSLHEAAKPADEKVLTPKEGLGDEKGD